MMRFALAIGLWVCLSGLALAINLPDPADVVRPAAAPIFEEIITKFVPVLASIVIGTAVVKRIAGGR